MSNSCVLPGFQFDTLSDWTIYVDGSLGDDTNSGSDPLFPLKTIQAAVNRLPKKIVHAVKVKVAAGNYAGFSVSGFSVQIPADISSQQAFLHVEGTMSNATPASTGTSSGLLTGFSARSGSTFAVATDSLNNMTSDEYKGKWLKFTSGTGSSGSNAIPAMGLILGNTATAFNIALIGATNPAAATGYQVVSPGTIIDSAVAPIAASGNPANVNAISSSKCGAAFVNNEGVAYAMSNIQFNTATALPNAVALSDARVRIFDCRFLGNTGLGTGIIYANANQNMSASELYRCSFSFPSVTGTMVSILPNGGNTSQPGVRIISSLLYGGAIALEMAACANGPYIEDCLAEWQVTGVSLSDAVGQGKLINSRFNNQTTAVALVGESANGMGACSVGITACNFAGNTTSISVVGGRASANLIGVTGSSNTTAILLSRGARVMVDAASSIAGTAQVSLDAVGTDLTTMRAASPKILATANFGTVIYQ